MSRGFAHLLTGTVIGRGFSFLLNIGISRILGPSQLGLFALIFNAVQSFELFTKLGLDYSLSLSLTEALPDKTTYRSQSSIQTIQMVLAILLVSVSVGCFLFWLWLSPGSNYLPETLGDSRNSIVRYLLLICVLESISSFCWDTFISLAKTKFVALRYAIFIPIKLFSFLVGCLLNGFAGGLAAYAITSFLVLIVLLFRMPSRSILIKLNLAALPKYFELISSGFGLYIVNALTALVYLPLWASLAASSGFDQLGYLRVGQLMVQGFSLIPGSLLPAYFLKLRLESTDKILSNKVLFLTWSLSLSAFTLYSVSAKPLTVALFGSQFLSSFDAGRTLILVSIIDSLVQILHTPYLAKKQINYFLVIQLIPVLLVFIFGSSVIGVFELEGFLALKLISSLIPFILYLAQDIRSSGSAFKAYDLAFITLALSILCFQPLNTVWLFGTYLLASVYCTFKFIFLIRGASWKS